MLNNLKNELVITLKLIIVFIVKIKKRGIVNFVSIFLSQRHLITLSDQYSEHH